LHAKDLKGKAHDFTLKSNSGKNIRLADLRGQVVMLNFWASWCGPCRQEMPLLDELYSRYSGAGFTLLGVNVEADSEAANAVLKEIPVSFPIVYDTTSKVSEAYDVDAMPSSVMIDCDGNMTYLHRGYKPGDEKAYKTHIKALLRSCSR
jgi:Thiol-disulfide isomerase and thioredoxins